MKYDPRYNDNGATAKQFFLITDKSIQNSKQYYP